MNIDDYERVTAALIERADRLFAGVTTEEEFVGIAKLALEELEGLHKALAERDPLPAPVTVGFFSVIAMMRTLVRVVDVGPAEGPKLEAQLKALYRSSLKGIGSTAQ